jgi:hypothetical protein
VRAFGDLPPDGFEPSPEPSEEPLSLGEVAGCRAQGEDRGQHLVHGVRVDRQHLGSAAEVRQCVLHHGDVHGAHGAQVLGDHQIRVQAGQRVLVEVVEVLSCTSRRGHERVDPGGVEPLGQGAGGDDAPLACGRRVVALEGHPDDVVARADGEQDLGRGGQERDDAHGPIVPNHPWWVPSGS